jgi:hypothetical protein
MAKLYTGRTLEDFWEPVLLPWFDGPARAAWRAKLPTIVVAPTAEVLHQLKALLFATGVPFFNVRLVLPDELRKELSGLAPGLRLPDARLLAAVVEAAANEEIAENPSDTIAQAVARGPQTLTETLDVLHQGGWSAEQIEGETMRRIGLRVERMLEECRIATSAQIDHRVATLSPEDAGYRFASVLAVGFDARHWSNWPLLKATCRLSKDFVACLASPTALAEQAELIWNGSFESLNGSLIPVCDALDMGAMKEVAAAIEVERPAAGPVPMEFLAANNLTSQARIVAERIVATLRAGTESIAVLVPGPGVTAREVSLALERLGIPHYNGLAVRQATFSNAETWSALIATVKDPTVPNLLAFLRLRGDLPAESFPHGIEKLLYTLDREGANFIFPEIKLLGGYLSQVGGRNADVGTFLLKWPQFPDSGTLAAYLLQLADLLESLGWTTARASLSEASNSLRDAGALRMTRKGFCDFIDRAVLAPKPIRSEVGNHPFSKVHVLRPEDAVCRRWQKIFFLGQNDGIWPPRVQPGGYLSDEDLVALNERIKKLNAAITRDGDGQFSVVDGRAYMVGPFENRALHVRDFVRLLESCTSATIVAAVEDETAGGAALHPGELYLRAYRAVRGANLPREELMKLACSTEQSIHSLFLLPNANAANTGPMMAAWLARRDTNAKDFSDYEFCLNTMPTWDLNVPASAWGRVFDRPAEVFLRHVLGVAPVADLRSEMPWAMVAGNWTHSWLQAAAPDGPAPTTGEWLNRVRSSARSLRSVVGALLEKEGRELPTWWTSLWAQALADAESFAREMGSAGRNGYVISEGKLPRTLVQLPSGRALAVGGRFDLVYTDLPVVANDYSHVLASLTDYKTGEDKPLTSSLLARGHGVQLGLYALALAALGARQVEITLQKSDTPATAQVTLDDVKANIDVIEKLADMAEFGRFGYYGDIRSEFLGASHYPIATLPAYSPRERFAAVHSL